MTEGEQPRYVRRWRQGDPREVRGRILFRDEKGDVWLNAAEVRALGLTDAIREVEGSGADEQARYTAMAETHITAMLQEGAPIHPFQSSRTDDVRPAGEGDGGAVPASEYFQHWPVPTDDNNGGDAEVLAPEEAPTPARTGLPCDGPDPDPPSGETDGGWRWSVSADGEWLRFDNRGPGGPRPRDVVIGALPMAVIVDLVRRRVAAVERQIGARPSASERET